MSDELFRDKGSKRRIAQIHWKASELASLVLVGLGVTALSIAVAVWMMSHPID